MINISTLGITVSLIGIFIGLIGMVSCGGEHNIDELRYKHMELGKILVILVVLAMASLLISEYLKKDLSSAETLAIYNLDTSTSEYIASDGNKIHNSEIIKSLNDLNFGETSYCEKLKVSKGPFYTTFFVKHKADF